MEEYMKMRSHNQAGKQSLIAVPDWLSLFIRVTSSTYSFKDFTYKFTQLDLNDDNKNSTPLQEEIPSERKNSPRFVHT